MYAKLFQSRGYHTQRTRNGDQGHKSYKLVLSEVRTEEKRGSKVEDSSQRVQNSPGEQGAVEPKRRREF